MLKNVFYKSVLELIFTPIYPWTLIIFLKVPSVRTDWICMRVVSLDSSLKGINRYMFIIFNFWSWTFEKTSKFWAASCKNDSNLLPCSDHSLHRILSCYWLAHFHLMKKTAKVYLYFDLGFGMMDASRNPKNNWCLSRIFGARFGE
jgi:hypothetical protein